MKTTLHFQRVPDWANGVLQDWCAIWAKVVNPPAGRVPLDMPRLLVRHWTDDRDGAYLRDGREGGARFVADMAESWTRTPATAYELANEPDCNTPEGLAALNAYTIGAIQEAERRRLTLCVLNLPEGNPSGDHNAIVWKWQQLAPAVQRAVQGGHYVGLHAYWRPGVEGPTGRYHALGRRQYDLEVLRGLGVDVSRLKVVINETGIDGGIAWGPAQKGWRDLSSADAYRAEIAEAEAYARTIPQIVALMLFTAGHEPPWGGFDIDEGFARSCTPALRAAAAAGDPGPTHPIAPGADVQAAIGEAVQASIIPLNPVAAFEVAGAKRGLLPASTEVDVEVGSVTYRAQAYRAPGRREWQEIVYCPVGAWGDLTWFERRN